MIGWLSEEGGELIVFLDIDGVLNNERTWKESRDFDPSKIKKAEI